MHSAPESLLQIYPETWSLRRERERPSIEEHFWKNNSVTSPFLPFCFSLIISLCNFAAFLCYFRSLIEKMTNGCVFSQLQVKINVLWYNKAFLIFFLIDSSCLSFKFHPPLELNDIILSCIQSFLLYSCERGWLCVAEITHCTLQLLNFV